MECVRLFQAKGRLDKWMWCRSTRTKSADKCTKSKLIELIMLLLNRNLRKSSRRSRSAIRFCFRLARSRKASVECLKSEKKTEKTLREILGRTRKDRMESISSLRMSKSRIRMLTCPNSSHRISLISAQSIPMPRRDLGNSSINQSIILDPLELENFFKPIILI